MADYFVTRHQGALDWARRRGIEAEAMAHLDPAMLRPGDRVLGTLPVHLAAEVCAAGASYLHLRLDLPARAARQTAERGTDGPLRSGTCGVRRGEEKPMIVADMLPGTVAAGRFDFFWDAAWWAEGAVNWLTFTVVVSVVLVAVRWLSDRIGKHPFLGWKLRVVGLGDVEQSLHWEEVRRVLESDFELWKLAKSVLSGICWTTLRTAAPAREAGWLIVPKAVRGWRRWFIFTKPQGGTIIIDLTRMPRKHRDKKDWAEGIQITPHTTQNPSALSNGAPSP